MVALAALAFPANYQAADFSRTPPPVCSLYEQKLMPTSDLALYGKFHDVRSRVLASSKLGPDTTSIICSGFPWIDAECFGAVGDDKHDDTAAIDAAFAWVGTVAGNCSPIHFQRRAYKVTADVIVDIGDWAANCKSDGLKILVEGGADFDGNSITSTPTFEIRCTGNTCNNVWLSGRLTIKGANDGPVFVLGKSDFSDAFSISNLNYIVPQNSGTGSAAGGAQINNVVVSVLKIEGAFAPTATGGDAVQLRGISQSDITVNGTWAHGTAVHVTEGTVSGNKIALLGGNNSTTCLVVDTAGATNNTFSPVDFTACTHALNSTAGSGNILINPVYGTADIVSSTGFTKAATTALP